MQNRSDTKVALINIVYNDKVQNTMDYLGPAYLSAYLESHGYITDIFFISNTNIDKGISEIKSFRPNIVGISLPVLTVQTLKEICKKLDKALDDCLFVCGGEGIFEYSEEILKNIQEITITCIGEGELTLLEICDRYIQGISYENCKGIAFRKDGNIIFTEPRPLIHDLDTLPFPKRKFGAAVNNILATRGCYYKCSFCTNSSYKKGRSVYRRRNPSNIAEEIRSIIKQQKASQQCNLDFVDPCIDGIGSKKDKEWLRRFADELSQIEYKIKYNVCLRANHWDINSQDDNDLLYRLRQTGMETVTIGIEAGNQSDLDLYNKKTTVQQNKDIINLLHNNYIHCDLQFINFNPYSTIERLRNNVDFLTEVQYAHLLFPFLIVFQCYRGTYFYDRMKNDKLILDATYHSRNHYFEGFGDYLYRYVDPKIQIYSECFTELYQKYYQEINDLQVRSINYETNINRIRKYSQVHLINDSIKGLLIEYKNIKLTMNNYVHEKMLQIYSLYDSVSENELMNAVRKQMHDFFHNYSSHIREFNHFQLKMIKRLVSERETDILMLFDRYYLETKDDVTIPNQF